jgi:hypothetical protein
MASAAPAHQGYGYSTLREFLTPPGAEAWGAENPRQMAGPVTWPSRRLCIASCLLRDRAYDGTRGARGLRTKKARLPGSSSEVDFAGERVTGIEPALSAWEDVEAGRARYRRA